MNIAFILALRPKNNVFYGAELSLKYLIDGLKTYDSSITITLFVRESNIPWRKLSDFERKEITKLFGVENIIYHWMPYISEPFYIKSNWKIKLRTLYSKMLFTLTNKKFCDELKKFDNIHINNPELYYIAKYIKASVHVRNYIEKQFDFIKYPNKFICIDNSTFNSINCVDKKDKFMIMNPYKSKADESIETSKFLKKIRNEYDKLYAIIGRVEDIKGVLYVIREFNLLMDPTSCLLIVGEGEDKEYMTKCVNEASNKSNIIFYGATTNTDSIYNIIDFNIRGDDKLAIGRTIIEAIHYGVKSIIPKKEYEVLDLEWITNEDIKSNITGLVDFYTPREENALSNKMKENVVTNKAIRIDSTVKYAADFLKTIRKLEKNI